MAFSFMQTISFIYLLIIRISTASLLSHDQQCLALLEFKQSVSHQPYASVNVGGFQKLDDSWRKITSNNASVHDSDCCLWEGVVCSKKGHVIELDLSQSSLYGPIKSNSSLFNLVHLQTLNLSMNDFVGSQIPSEIGRLKQLKSLDLSDSSFSGQIPNEISHLMQLTLLDLSSNSLKLQSPSFDHLVQNLTRLEALHLSGVDISSFIPPFLANFSSLKSIDLSSCQLRNEFPSSIFNLPQLKFLSMANNSMLTGFLPEFQNNTILEHINLFATSFAGSIPESINKLNHLVVLHLVNCYFTGCIPRSLSNMTQFTHLALGQDEILRLDFSSPRRLSNPVGLEVCEKGRMHDWIRRLVKLEYLFMVNMNIYEEILPSLANLTKLSKVVMRENSIYGHIPSSFMNRTNLRKIDLGRNQMEGQISSSFSNFKSLEYLHLNSNNFSGGLDLDTFVGLTKLKSLLLDYNRISLVTTNNHTNGAILPELEQLGLSSCNLSEFPIFLRFKNKITSLSLANNKIEGLVPEWILNNNQATLRNLDLSLNSISGFDRHPHFLPWVCLEAFSISYNQIGGRIPIPPETTIVYDISNNNFIGEIPPQICELKSLRVLDLSSNNMTGTLPPCLGNLSNSLSILNLNRNNFHGTMMGAFTNGCLVEMLDLTDNKLTGRLSKSLANCTNLEFLALGGNSFEDVFPIWLRTLAKLQVLILGSNKLFGVIEGLYAGSQFPKLRILDLSNNSFSGRLPQKFFQTWNAMKSFDVKKSYYMENDLYVEVGFSFSVPYAMTLTNKGVKREFPHILNVFTAIDLSCNGFEGQIPESLSGLQALQSVNLSNNHLTGSVLPSLGNLKNLESLDLSQNQLAGEIPHQLLQLGFLAIFNVSFNHLHGTIPQGKQFNTFENNSYMGNSDLCGTPLSKKCRTLMTPTLPPTNNEYVSFLPSDKIDWIIIFLGFGGGLVIGIVLGNLLYGRYSDWLNESSRTRKEISVRPLRNTRRN